MAEVLTNNAEGESTKAHDADSMNTDYKGEEDEGMKNKNVGDNTSKRSTSRFSPRVIRHTLQKQLTRRRVWLVAAVWLYMIVCYPVAVVMQIANVSTDYMDGNPAYSAAITAHKLASLSQWIGLRQNYSWVYVLMGVLLAIEGYSYLFSMEKQDFYDSQPVSRKERFRAIYRNGFLIFMIPLVVCTLLSVLFAALMGGMNAVTFGEAMLQLGRNLLIFAASYGIGILSVMLTGNPIVCVLTAAFFLLIEPAYAISFRVLESDFFATFSSYSPNTSVSLAFTGIWGAGGAMFSPLYNAMKGTDNILFANYVTDVPMNMPLLKNLLELHRSGDIVDLLDAIVLPWISAALFRRRKEEAAGGTVLFAPVRLVIRIASSVAVGLFACVLLYNTEGTDFSGRGSGQVFIIVGIVIAAILAAGIIQIIYALDFREFFRRSGEMIAACAIAVFLFAVFRYDLFGYDRYVPAPDKVSSIALYVSNDLVSSYENPMDSSNPVGGEEHVMETMNLTDIEAVEQITSAGMDLMKRDTEADRKGSGPDENLEGWSATVCYRMKNGRKIFRDILIPSHMDSSVLNRVIGSAAYRQGFFPVYDDNNIVKMEEASPSEISFYYSNGSQSTPEVREETVPGKGVRASIFPTDHEAKEVAIAVESADQETRIRVKQVQTSNQESKKAEGAADGSTAQENKGPGDGTVDGTIQNREGFYKGFARAYRRDLQKYNFTLANAEPMIGKLTINVTLDTTDFDTGYASQYYNEYAVYPSYTNTIQYLKKYGLFLDPPSEKDFDHITITKWSEEAGEDLAVTYTDKDLMKNILDACDLTTNWDWKRSSDYEGNYEIEASDASGSNMLWELNFRKGEVPAFVDEDLQKAAQEILKNDEPSE